MQNSLKDIFDNYVKEKRVFKDKDTLSIRFAPDNIPHRDKQLKQIGLIIAPVLRNEKPSNIFMYGKTGTGKTLVVSSVINTLLKSAEGSDSCLNVIYVNCKMKKTTDTEYRLLAHLLSYFGETVPYTGLPTNELYSKFYKHLDSNNQNLILVLDEVDSLIRKIGDDMLYNLTRVNQELGKSQLTIIGISNNISFIDTLDPRVRSSLSEEEIIFPPYNASELRDILTERTGSAFSPGAVPTGVVAKCAALAAQEHGDARKALDLLRVAGEMAEREGSSAVEERHVDLAEKKLDTDRLMETIRSQPKQSQAVLKAILSLYGGGEKNIQTGDVYDLYSKICRSGGITPLTQRRVSDLISELDMFGVINARVTSKGRYGRTRAININHPDTLIKKMEGFLAGEFG
jgi:cell division control protein 6